MKRILHLLLLASFLFLFLYLVRQDYILPGITSWPLLGTSLLLLFAGFYAGAFSWKVALASHGFTHGNAEVVVSQGLPVFTKYIPGKIWVILGRAGYLSPGGTGLKNRTFVSLKEQLIYLWAGFAASAVPTILFYGLQWISILVLLIVAGLTLFLFFEKVHRWILELVKRLTRKEVELPLIRFRRSIPMIGAVLLIWLCWTLGFYLFMQALGVPVTPVMMFAFPLSVCLGLIAIILPGGIGLREGIMIGYLTLAGMDVEGATTISFVNRLWFICGELFIFLLATILRLTRKKR